MEQRHMTTTYLDADQMKRLRRRVLELKTDIPNAANATVIRYSLDYVLSNWEDHRESIAKVAELDTNKKYR